MSARTARFVFAGFLTIVAGSALAEDALRIPLADDTKTIVTLGYPELKELAPGNLWIDTALDLGLIHVGTPYKFGGDDWTTGIDCSHFTWQVYQMAGTGYKTMMATEELRDLTQANGLHQIAKADARPGDLLVYGYYDVQQAWHGHVVILVDAGYTAGGRRGLVVGSHGDVGVQFITYDGFPDYFREKTITLRNVLRVDTP